MIHIKKFIDRVSLMESKRNKDVIIPMDDARGLRDELSKLLSDLHVLTETRDKEKSSEVLQVEVRGGSFK